MPEYFDISLIGRKTNSSKNQMKNCLNKLGLFEGENTSELFKGRHLIVSIIEDEEYDFEEVSIGILKQIFHKEKFEDELREFTNFVNYCFKCNRNLMYALCSYELNGYLLGGIKSLQELNNIELLHRFPMVYKREMDFELPTLQTNTEAQEIFV